jgi:hypothetical protein
MRGEHLDRGSHERHAQSNRRERTAARVLTKRSLAMHIQFLLVVCILAPAQALLPRTLGDAPGQRAETLSQVKKVYVGSLGDKEGATELRDKLIQRLRKSRDIDVVENPSQADAVLTGTGEIWVTGYISTNPKPSPYNRQPVYDGYISIELRAKDHADLWSCRVTPAKFGWNRVPQNLANRSATKLLAALHQNGASKP